MRRSRSTATVAFALVAVTLLGACTAQGSASDGETGEESVTAELSGTLTVFAAASLTETFDALAVTFEEQHPSVDVVVNYGGSSALAQQIIAGAPADVFAAASESTMNTVTDAGLSVAPVVFATNSLELVVPAGNPAGVSGLDDLAREDLAIALCDPLVPCGAAAEKLLAAAGVSAVPDTLEEDVKAVLTKVRLGEADAGLVYVTDGRAAGDDVESIEITDVPEAVNRYPVSVLTDAPNPDAARAWIDLLLGPEGQKALTEAGFGAP